MIRTAVRGPLALCVLTLVVGCGTSPRDEYERIRDIVVEPQPGDASTIAAIDPASLRGLARPGSAVVIAVPRGVVSDQHSAAE